MNSALDYCQGISNTCTGEHGEDVVVYLYFKWLSTRNAYIQRPEYYSFYFTSTGASFGFESKESPARRVKGGFDNTSGIHSITKDESRQLIGTNTFNSSSTIDQKNKERTTSPLPSFFYKYSFTYFVKTGKFHD